MRTKQFLTISERRTDLFTPEDFAAHVGAEAVQARELYAEGFIRQIWHRADGKGPVFFPRQKISGRSKRS